MWRLSYIIVTPNFHKIHHHYLQPHTDSNYGNIFSIWDRLFGTYRTFNREKLVYGVGTEQAAAILNACIGALVKILVASFLCAVLQAEVTVGLQFDPHLFIFVSLMNFLPSLLRLLQRLLHFFFSDFAFFLSFFLVFL